jgi:hypothetical protein
MVFVRPEQSEKCHADQRQDQPPELFHRTRRTSLTILQKSSHGSPCQMAIARRTYHKPAPSQTVVMSRIGPLFRGLGGFGDNWEGYCSRRATQHSVNHTATATTMNKSITLER